VNDVEREDAVEAQIESVRHQLMAFIDIVDARHGESTPNLREQLCVDFGKSLVLMGCTFMGAAAGLDADTGLKPALDCVAAIKDIVEKKRSGL
jgi:hypothetical protein